MPLSASFDGSSNLFIADYLDSRIRELAPG
jgi:hypothetical protein